MNILNYLQCLDNLKYYIKVSKEAKKDNDYIASTFSVSTHVPIIAVYYYIAKLEGMTPQIEEKISFLKDFYKVDKIEGLEELYSEE